jgi:hypothetical protein
MIRIRGGMDAPGGAHKGMATVSRPELLNSTMMRGGREGKEVWKRVVGFGMSEV